jgi:hypothetical protein
MLLDVPEDYCTTRQVVTHDQKSLDLPSKRLPAMVKKLMEITFFYLNLLHSF